MRPWAIIKSSSKFQLNPYSVNEFIKLETCDINGDAMDELILLFEVSIPDEQTHHEIYVLSVNNDNLFSYHFKAENNHFASML